MEDIIKSTLTDNICVKLVPSITPRLYEEITVIIDSEIFNSSPSTITVPTTLKAKLIPRKLRAPIHRWNKEMLKFLVQLLHLYGRNYKISYEIIKDKFPELELTRRRFEAKVQNVLLRWCVDKKPLPLRMMDPGKGKSMIFYSVSGMTPLLFNSKLSKSLKLTEDHKCYTMDICGCPSDGTCLSSCDLMVWTDNHKN